MDKEKELEKIINHYGLKCSNHPVKDSCSAYKQSIEDLLDWQSKWTARKPATGRDICVFCEEPNKGDAVACSRCVEKFYAKPTVTKKAIVGVLMSWMVRTVDAPQDGKSVRKSLLGFHSGFVDDLLALLNGKKNHAYMCPLGEHFNNADWPEGFTPQCNCAGKVPS